MDINGSRPAFRLSAETRALFERLIQVKVGEVIGYPDLSALVNSDVQQQSRSALQSARRKALKEHQVVFDPVIGVGLKRLNDTEIVGTSHGALRRMRRMAHRAAVRISAVQSFDALSEDKKIMHNAAMSAFRALGTLFSSRGIHRIEAAVEQARKPLAARRTLELFDRRT